MLKRRNLVTLIAGTFLVVSSAMAQFADRNIKFTNGVNEDHPVGLGVKKMQEVLAAKTGGKMKITAFWGGAAGGDLPATQALRAGTQEMVCTSSSPLVGIIKELGVCSICLSCLPMKKKLMPCSTVQLAGTSMPSSKLQAW